MYLLLSKAKSFIYDLNLIPCAHLKDFAPAIISSLSFFLNFSLCLIFTSISEQTRINSIHVKSLLTPLPILGPASHLCFLSEENP